MCAEGLGCGGAGVGDGFQMSLRFRFNFSSRSVVGGLVKILKVKLWIKKIKKRIKWVIESFWGRNIFSVHSNCRGLREPVTPRLILPE